MIRLQSHVWSVAFVAASSMFACGSVADDHSNTSSIPSGPTYDHHPYPPPPPPGRVETTELGSCLLIPAFDAADIQREQAAAGPDKIYYDLSIRELTVIQLTSFDGYGNLIHTERRNKCVAKPQRFEIMSNVGNEAALAKKIRYYLKTQEAYRCDSEQVCF